MRHTFIITSTINTDAGVIDIDTRFKETIETINSVIRNVPDAIIVFADNSIGGLTDDQYDEIYPLVHHLFQMEHSVASLQLNNHKGKGAGECYLMYELLKHLPEDLIGDRVFKLSGRYKLQDTFDITEYEKPELYGKITGQINQWDVSWDNFKTHRETVTYFETRLWSFCSSLFDEYFKMLPYIFNHMMTVDNNLEKVYFKLFDKSKIVEFRPLHVEGITADTGKIKIE